MDEILALLIPIFICVVLPVSIVAIYYFTKLRRQRYRSDVAMKAIESGMDVDLAKLLGEERWTDSATPMHKYLRNLKTGLILLAIGMAFLIFWIYMLAFDTSSNFESAAGALIAGMLFALIGGAFLYVARVIKRNIRESDTEE